jgi:hypothetical protein
MSNRLNRVREVGGACFQGAKRLASNSGRVLGRKWTDGRAAAGYLVGRYILGDGRDAMRDARQLGPATLIPPIVYRNAHAKKGHTNSDSASFDSSETSASD